MNKIVLILILLITTVFGNPLVKIFDKEIYKKFQNWDQLKNEKKSEVTFVSYNSGKTAKNCIEYLKYNKNHDLATTADYQMKWEYLECEILDHIQNAKVEYQENSNIDYANYIYNVTNIKSFANSLNPKYKVAHITLNKIFNNVSKKDNLLLEINEKNWHYYFQVVGIEKNDNKQYLLVYFLDEALKSSYFSESFLILDYKQPISKNIQKEKEEKNFFSKLLKWFGFSKFNKKLNTQYC